MSAEVAVAFHPYSAAVTPGPGVWPHPGCRPGRAEVAPWGGGLHAVVPAVPEGCRGLLSPRPLLQCCRGRVDLWSVFPLYLVVGAGSLFFLSL